MARDRDRSSSDDNPLGLGPRDAESSNTGSAADTSYDAAGSDPYTTGEPEKRGAGRQRDAQEPSTPADPSVPSSDEP